MIRSLVAAITKVTLRLIWLYRLFASPGSAMRKSIRLNAAFATARFATTGSRGFRRHPDSPVTPGSRLRHHRAGLQTFDHSHPLRMAQRIALPKVGQLGAPRQVCPNARPAEERCQRGGDGHGIACHGQRCSQEHADPEAVSIRSCPVAIIGASKLTPSSGC
jgi:hypothetical protein